MSKLPDSGTGLAGGSISSDLEKKIKNWLGSNLKLLNFKNSLRLGLFHGLSLFDYIFNCCWNG